MEGKTERDGWTQVSKKGGEEKEKKGQKEIKIHGNGERKE